MLKSEDYHFQNFTKIVFSKFLKYKDFCQNCEENEDKFVCKIYNTETQSNSNRLFDTQSRGLHADWPIF